ncbi:MAG: hypothetical protein CO030_04495 [Candidatus Magasanikbacteria bacterium CG_4_9_14_0_2_um_filter_42_11]|uniref:Antitoxin n=1 Tax=Candidatus Magasanikbacteria bacterium CG_4_9_14_0_2_um_filter_42_11 TaxID=1974643 RepID=A0A2M8F8S3_9BACT|nr:MAG: hypothetical protein COU34_00735 [Candidatus Magasanikbacteria bacterium CG10_big_fil_rev_8_21_14_0_10_43_9]PIY92670.1 MAG: hypothetical protein COY70_01990 [Candidatus Magasanikbacteria bacterium CG_4_10_14_0_8_um_filter_42_12]PJC52122.1 MAG: hypothetical protein CO030_04495 [Candidatus Magasanikbacteria bacterium CG_4_9_14_0_2_um_filter_42_11]
MNRIINTTQLQQKIGQVAKDVENNPYIVVNRGQARLVVLPYFDEGVEKIEEYFEDFSMRKNKKALQEVYKESLASGESDLRV